MTRRPTPSIIDAVLTADVLPDRTALRGRLRWDYSQVAPVDRRTVEDAAVDILANGQRAMESASAAGQRLIEVKRLLNHGQFGDWIETEFGMTQRMAQMWMNIARTFDGKSEIISLFSETAVALLAAPSTPEPARQEAIAEAQATGRSPSVQRTKEIIAQHKPGPVPAPIPQPTPREYAAAVQAVTVDVLPPSDAPLPQWAEEPAATAFTVPDGRIPAAQRLIALYREAMATEDQYGALTGQFSDWLAPKRELSAMIAQLEHLISVIQHPEEVTPDN